MYTVIHP